MRRTDDFLRLSSYILLGRSYQAYRIAKKVYWALFKRGIPHRLPSYHKISVIVEGFAHSGNSFIRTNILPGYQTRTSSFHRSWAVKRALKNKVPTIVLIRDPLEVAKSLHYRSMTDCRGPIPISIALGCWIGYHIGIWGLRRHVLIITFPDIVSDYDKTRFSIESFAPIKMNVMPDYAGMNRHAGDRPPLRLGRLDSVLLRYAHRIYHAYLQHADNQKRFGLQPIKAPRSPQQQQA